MELLRVKDLTILAGRQKLVENINFSLSVHGCLGIVGESGSGKSVTAKALMGLLPPNLHMTGVINFSGENILEASREEVRKFRGRRICLILQDAMSAFDPLYTIGQQMTETFCEKLGVGKKEAVKIALRELERVNIREPAQVLRKYPHQLSGGMLQRIMLAVAMAVKPDIIIADEPTTALDPLTQQQVIKELQKLRAESGVAMLFISHDLEVIRQVAETVLVMKQGRQVELGTIEQIFSAPEHEYTKYLMAARAKITKAFSKAMGKDSLLCSK